MQQQQQQQQQQYYGHSGGQQSSANSTDPELATNEWRSPTSGGPSPSPTKSPQKMSPSRRLGANSPLAWGDARGGATATSGALRGHFSPVSGRAATGISEDVSWPGAPPKLQPQQQQQQQQQRQGAPGTEGGNGKEGYESGSLLPRIAQASRDAENTYGSIDTGGGTTKLPPATKMGGTSSQQQSLRQHRQPSGSNNSGSDNPS